MDIQTVASRQQTFQTDFCPLCGGLIDLDTIDTMVTCHVCKNKHSFNEFLGKPIKTQLKLTKDKEWLDKYENKKLKQKRGKSKKITKQKCPVCGHHEMSYFSVQTRSADEGSTVFYECQKCGHTYSINN